MWFTVEVDQDRICGILNITNVKEEFKWWQLCSSELQLRLFIRLKLNFRHQRQYPFGYIWSGEIQTCWSYACSNSILSHAQIGNTPTCKIIRHSLLCQFGARTVGPKLHKAVNLLEKPDKKRQHFAIESWSKTYKNPYWKKTSSTVWMPCSSYSHSKNRVLGAYSRIEGGRLNIFLIPLQTNIPL